MRIFTPIPSVFSTQLHYSFSTPLELHFIGRSKKLFNTSKILALTFSTDQHRFVPPIFRRTSQNFEVRIG
ncbi:hypothetical protein ALT1644_350029 [Alteromonas macleodii]